MRFDINHDRNTTEIDMNVEQQLKALQQDEARLARKKERLMAQLEEQREAQKHLDALLEKSGYKNAKALIQALASRYNIDLGKAGGHSGRRARARMDAATRDKVKRAASGGKSAYAVSKEMGISYPVVRKVIDGGYDHL